VARHSELVEAVLLRAIRRKIAEAIQSNTIISAAECADEILGAYPTSAGDRNAIADEVMIAAARAGVPVEFGTDSAPKPRAA
jgi:hypothetical protein